MCLTLSTVSAVCVVQTKVCEVLCVVGVAVFPQF